MQNREEGKRTNTDRINSKQPLPQHNPNKSNAAKAAPNTKRQLCSRTNNPQKLSSVPPQKPDTNHAKPKSNKRFKLSDILCGILPTSVYNPKTKKLFGFFTAEDLLLIALIFLFADNDEDSDPTIIIALIYILISDYIDLPELSL